MWVKAGESGLWGGEAGGNGVLLVHGEPGWVGREVLDGQEHGRVGQSEEGGRTPGTAPALGLSTPPSLPRRLPPTPPQYPLQSGQGQSFLLGSRHGPTPPP